MLTGHTSIRNDSFITDIVVQDYRTSAVFRKYGIDYCCSGRVPLQMACDIRGLNIGQVKKELEHSLRVMHISASINFNEWTVDFLVDYIVNIHHAYLTGNFPDIIDTLHRFTESHRSQYSFLPVVLESVHQLRDDLVPRLQQEEHILFPYIKQVAHAYENRESYAALLVRTLRKPVENIINHEHGRISKSLHRLRELTDNYTPPAHACLSHKVSYARLKEFDNDLVQHVHLESNILFPKAIAMEKEMLDTR